MKLHVIDADGQAHTIEGVEGWRLMEVIRDQGIGMRADCGGCLACATCHVYVDDGWMARLYPPIEDEDRLLEESFVREATSRLSCQIILGPEHDGLTVRIASDAV